MLRTFITGSADGLGRATAQALLAQGRHSVSGHAARVFLCPPSAAFGRPPTVPWASCLFPRPDPFC